MNRCLTGILISAWLLHIPFHGRAQDAAAERIPPSSTSLKSGLFDSDEVITITLKGNIRKVISDRSVEAKYHPLVLSIEEEKGKMIDIPVSARTRGHFRKLKQNCFYPPLLLKFEQKKKELPLLLRQQSRLKLVMPCGDDEYIIREWMVYRLYNLVTEKSFRARLVTVKLEDSHTKKKPAPFYGILLEEENQLAKRHQSKSIERKLSPQQVAREPFLAMALFQYLAGNTDWSVQYMQNIKLLAADSLAEATAVPYDFDHCGLVNSPYALPAEELRLASVRERRFRGFCVQDIAAYDHVISHFNRIRESIYKLYKDCPLLSASYVKSTLRYLHEFYDIMNDPVARKKELLYPCDKKGTGGIVIRGLKED